MIDLVNIKRFETWLKNVPFLSQSQRGFLQRRISFDTCSDSLLSAACNRPFTSIKVTMNKLTHVAWLTATALLAGCATTSKIALDDTKRPPTSKVEVFKDKAVPIRPRSEEHTSELQ